MAREQGVFLALDEAAILTAEAGVFGLTHLVERVAEMAHDVELVEQNRGLWRMRMRRKPEWLPHIHDRQAKEGTLLLAEPKVELIHARLRAVLSAEPDRPPALQ